jgi:hypothetical protein
MTGDGVVDWFDVLNHSYFMGFNIGDSEGLCNGWNGSWIGFSVRCIAE